MTISTRSTVQYVNTRDFSSAIDAPTNLVRVIVGSANHICFMGDLIGVMNSAERRGLISGDGGWTDGAVKRWPLRLKSTESNDAVITT